MRSFRRVTLRVAPALASVASVLLFATCDFDKISGTPAKLSLEDINRLFSITPTDTSIILGNSQQFSITPGAGVNLDGTTTRWSSSSTTVLGVDSTGFAQALTIGTATITARLLAPELDTGYSKTHAMRVRFKGIEACNNTATRCSPLALDSIAGLNLSRPFSFYGTDISDVIQQPALTGVTITTRDSGATTNTVASVTGSNVFARKNGVAYVIGVFETMRDSIRVKVRQVAKTLLLPDYTVQHLNVNRVRPSFTMKDINDSVMTESPRLRWRSSDTTVFTIDSLTGVLRVKRKYAVGDTARIFMTADSIQRNSRLLIDQKVARLRIDAGNNQTDTVLVQLPTALKVTALDSGDTPVAGVPVTFRLGIAGRDAGATITDSVQITDANGAATLGSWKLGHRAGTQTVRAVFGTDTTTLFVADAKSKRPAKLAFGVHPKSTAATTTIAPAVTVTVQDSIGNVTTATDSVSIAIGNNPSGAILSGTKKVAAVSGTATFSTLSMSPGGEAFTLTATSGSLTSAISDAFDVYGSATKLGVLRQPVTTSAGAILDTIQIRVLDAQNTTVATATNSVTVAILNNAGTPSGTLAGTTTVTAVNGIATFTGLSINNPGSGYTLQATATGLTPVTTSAFSIDPVGLPTKLAFSTQPPTSVTAGSAQTVAVTVQDANGATVSTSTAAVTISLVSAVTGAQLTGTLTRNAQNGVATFTGVTLNKVGTGFKVQATSTGLTETQSNAFAVTAGAAAKLAFVDQPTHTVVSTTMAPAVTVNVLDANDNLVSGGAATSVSLSVFNCSGPTLTGTTSANTVNGVATFNAFGVGATTGISCRLSASATGLTSGGSDFFSVVSATGAIRLSFGTQPGNGTAGSSLSSFTVRAVDQNGTVVSAAAPFITLKVLRGPGTVNSGSTATASGGTASFFNTQIQTAGTYKLLATATGFKPDSSVEITIQPAAAFRLGFVTEPTQITAGVPFSPAVAVAVQDQYGNTVPSFNATIDLSRNSGSFLASLEGGPTSVATVNGIATFNGLTIKRAGTGYDLFASHAGGSLFGKVSASFTVTAGPASKLGFTTHPSSFQTAGDQFNVTVQAQDSVGNVLSNFTNQVTLALTGGDPAATLTGTTSMLPTSGSASFTGLSVQKAGSNYRVNASASGLTTGQSNTFQVDPGTATKLAWLDQIQNTVQKAGLDNGSASLPRVAAQDQYGNTTNTFFTIQIAIGTNPGGMGMLQNGNSVTNIQYNTGGDGIIELTGMSFSGSGNGLTLLATTPFSSLTSSTSNAFNVAAFGSAAKLAFKQQPTNGTYAVALNPTVEVRVEDDFGNTVTNAGDVITIAKGNDPVGATTLTGGNGTGAVSGVASFPGLYLDKAGNGFTVEATAAGLTSVVSNSFNITSPGHVANASSMSDMTRIGDKIYWIESLDNGTIKTVSTTGGTITTLANVGTARARRIGTDGTDLYWIEEGTGVATGSVRKYTISNSTASNLATGLSNVRSEANTFAVVGTTVYFHGLSQGGTNAAIKTVSTTGGLQTPTDLHAGGSTGLVHYFTVSGGQVYYYDAFAAKIARRPAAGGVATFATDIVGNAQRLVLGGNNTLYFSEGGNIRQLPNAHTAVNLVATTPVSSISTVYNMQMEGDFLYIKTGGTVRRYDVTLLGQGGSFADPATNALQAQQTILLDGAHIYYSNNSGGIGKIQK